MQQLLSHCIPQVCDAASDKTSFERRQKEIKAPHLRRRVNCSYVTGAAPVGADNDALIPIFFEEIAFFHEELRVSTFRWVVVTELNEFGAAE